MVPLRGLSLSPRAPTEGMEMVVHQRRKMTPVRRRWGSINATPGGPGRTPGKSATPMLQEEQRVDYDDEGIGSMMDGIENENENDEVDLVGVRHPFWFLFASSSACGGFSVLPISIASYIGVPFCLYVSSS